MAASPIVLISRTGAAVTSLASSARRPATPPSSWASTSTPRRVKPTRSAKHTVSSWASATDPASRSAAPDHAPAHGVAQVGLIGGHEHRVHGGGELLGQLGKTRGHVVLGVARLQERLHEHARGRRGQAGHRLAEHAGHLADGLLAQSGLEVQPGGLAPSRCPPRRRRGRRDRARAGRASAAGGQAREPADRCVPRSRAAVRVPPSTRSTPSRARRSSATACAAPRG